MRADFSATSGPASKVMMSQSWPDGSATTLPSRQPGLRVSPHSFGTQAGSNGSLLLIVQEDALRRSASTGAEITQAWKPVPQTQGVQSSNAL